MMNVGLMELFQSNWVMLDTKNIRMEKQDEEFGVWVKSG